MAAMNNEHEAGAVQGVCVGIVWNFGNRAILYLTFLTAYYTWNTWFH